MKMMLNQALENIERTMPSIAFSDSWKCIKEHLSASERVAVPDGIVLEALNEAGRRYPEASNAIVWLSGALAAPQPPEGAQEAEFKEDQR